MSYKVVYVSKGHEAIGMKIWAERDPIGIINYYNPCGHILEDVRGSFQDRVVWYGDFNYHNSLWGRNRMVYANGAVIGEFVDEHNLVYINTEEGTCYNSMQNTKTALDLTFVSSAIASMRTWNVVRHMTVGSDHYPLRTEVGTKILFEKVKYIYRWKLGNANWEAFQDVSTNRFKVENQDVNKFNEI